MIPERIKQLTPFYVMEILEKAIQLENIGEKVIHLEVGEPDFDTPQIIKDAAKESLDRGETSYTHSLGLIELREEITRYYKKNYNVNVDPDQIIVTNGTSPGLFLVFSTLFDIGDEIILTNPGYPCYKNILKFLGVKIKYINVYEDEGYQLNVEKLKKLITNKTKAILINSPNNPTGTVLTIDNLKDLVNLGIFIISDEIYHGLVYEGKAHTVLEVTDNAIVLNGFSKLFAMTGWRLGFIIAPKEFIRSMQILQQNFFISANSFVQKAGIIALRNAENDVKKMVEIYNKRRKLMLEKLKDIGFEIKYNPTGAFYIFINVKKYTNDSLSFAMDILDKVKVGVTPGIDFGSNGEGFIRLCYANSIENILEGLERLEKYFKSL